MTRTRFTHWVVLVCIGTLAACTSDQEGPAGNTELNVIIDNGTGNGSSGVVEIDVKSVEYTIVCSGGQQGPGFLDDGDTFPDAVTLNGNLEVVDGRTSGTPPVPTEVWQGFMDIPPGECLVQLRARDADGEVICSGDNVLADLADRTVDANEFQKVDILLVCDVSFQAPVGNLDVDGTFSFVVGNFCPDLFVLNCLDTNLGLPTVPVEDQTSCEVRFRDGDEGCGEGCDPQVCVENATTGLLDCFPASPVEDQLGNSMAGVQWARTTITCDGGSLDCNNDGTFGDTSCTIDDDQLGTLAVNAGIVPNPAAFGVDCAGAAPGSTINCTAYTTDGDRDCDKTKVVSVECAGLNFCDLPTTDCSVDSASTCLIGSCDRTAQACVTDPVPAGGGNNCNFAPSSGPGQCDGAGNCDDFGCQTDADCDPTPANECTEAPGGACVPPVCCLDGDCSGDEVNVVNGTPCTAGTLAGTCQGSVPGDSVCVPDPFCGDGNVDVGLGEECDDGAANSDTEPDACRTDCTNPICGDGVVDSGEQCEPPNTATCDATCQGLGPDCGDLVCNFDAATGSVINLTTPLPVPLDLAATGSVNVLCSGNNLDTDTGKCGCDAEFVTVDPLEIVGFLTACLVPVPAGLCPVGDIDCDGGNDQDLTVTVDHNLNTTLSLPACSDAADPNGQCASDCGGYCAGLGSIPASAQCEGYCQIAGTFCNTDDPDEPGAVTCPVGDTCVGGDPVIHPGACQCTCLTLGDGAPDAAGDARFFAGFGLNVLLNSSPSDTGPDGLPCTADDDPSIVIPPQCAPFTTTTATTSINNSGDIPGNTLPTTGPTTVEGTPFTCGGGIPSSTVGTDLRTAASFLDSTLGDIAATIQLNCQ